MFKNGKEPRLVDLTSTPTFFADGVGKVTVEGPNVRVVYFEYRTVGTERVRMPVLEMVRPIEGVKVGSLRDAIAQATGKPMSPHSKH